MLDIDVIWGGEFGRTPYSEGAKGRDHHSLGFSMWLAGGGVKGGFVHGATDELGMQAVKDRMHVHDLHATILHLMGLNHERLTYRYSGRDFRLTDVSGRVREPAFSYLKRSRHDLRLAILTLATTRQSPSAEIGAPRPRRPSPGPTPGARIPSSPPGMRCNRWWFSSSSERWEEPSD